MPGSVLSRFGVEPPQRLDGLLAWAESEGWTLRSPADRRGLMPLLLPVAERDGEVLGLLRWPTPERGMSAPVVRSPGWQVHLVAPDVDTFLRRALVERDAAGWDPAFARMLDPDATLYTPGALTASRLPMAAYLLLHVGLDHDAFAALIDGHLARGDVQAALVTGDRVARESHGFARAIALRARSLERAGRADEARDTAHVALLAPAWTLGEPFAPFARLAGWRDPITSISYQRLADDPTKLPADRAAHRLDQIAVDEGDWDAARAGLAALYREAGLDQVAELVAAE
ncbi:MAG: hypothetical protein ACI8PZ_004468 [Myxococcota bacterium]|jgi:hypothetical protein